MTEPDRHRTMGTTHSRKASLARGQVCRLWLSRAARMRSPGMR